jgi:hypothetical protein
MMLEHFILLSLIEILIGGLVGGLRYRAVT